MSTTPVIWLVAGSIVLLNLPFGFWRAGVRKLSAAWFLAIHLPVLLAIGLRWLLALSWQPANLPLFVGAFTLGQWLGGRLRRSVRPSAVGLAANGRSRKTP